MKKLERKFKKLVTKPGLFFSDAIDNRKKVELEIVVDKKARINRDLLSLKIKDEDLLTISKVDRTVRDFEFSSLFLVNNTVMNFNKAPVVGDILKNNDDFIGFREKNFFLGLFDEGVIDQSFDVREVLSQNCWRNQPFSCVKNVFILNPENKLPELIRCSTHNINVYCIYTENYRGDINIDYDIDAAIVHKKSNVKLGGARRVDLFGDTKQLIECIKKLIIIKDSKNIDLLLPVAGDVPYIEKIDFYNSCNSDLFIKARDCKFQGDTYSEICDSIVKNCEYILARDSIYKKYQSLIDEKRIKDFIVFASKDGFRIRFI